MSERKSRDEETRSMNTRSREERNEMARRAIQMEYFDPYKEVYHKKPDDVDYAFIRVSVRDVPDNNRLVEMERLGWTPVPASRHPELSSSSHYGHPATNKGYIIEKGGILCERDKALGELERQKRRERNWVEQHSLPGTEGYQGMPGIIAGTPYHRQKRGFSANPQNSRGFGYEPNMKIPGFNS